MALNFPSNPTNLQQYTDPNGVVWEYISGKGVWEVLRDDALKEFSGAKISLSTIQALTATGSAVSFDTEDFDLGNYYIGTSPSRLTAPSPGFYRINLLAIAGPQGSGASYTFTIKKNQNNTITTTTAGANQSIAYDEIVQLQSGDYVELYASETDSVGEVEVGSFFEIQNIGDLVGSAQSPATTFSGLELTLTSDEALTSTPTAVTWDYATFNTNADINGNVYWNISDSSKAYIYTTGYYNIKAFFQAGSQGNDESYTIDLRINGSSSGSASLGPNDTVNFDDIYNFASGSYIQFFASETGSVGEITTDSYFELIRLGV